MHNEARRTSAFFTKQGNKLLFVEILTYQTVTFTSGKVSFVFRWKILLGLFLFEKMNKIAISFHTICAAMFRKF